MNWFGKKPDPDVADLQKEAQEAISESTRVNRRIGRIVDEYRNTEKVLVEVRKRRKGAI